MDLYNFLRSTLGLGLREKGWTDAFFMSHELDQFLDQVESWTGVDCVDSGTDSTRLDRWTGVG